MMVCDYIENVLKMPTSLLFFQQNMNIYFVIVFYYFTVITCENVEDLLTADPSLWPGHLEAFGSKQKTVEVEQVDEWPTASTFFEEYVEASKPVLFKGLAKSFPAFKLFNDDYLKSFVNADRRMVYAEAEKKENRTKGGSTMSFQEFVKRYHQEDLYMVNALPKELQKDVLMPPPLRCEETRELLSSQVTWFSSGGTKSVLHNDDVDNINCLYRGKKQLLFIEYTKNKRFVPLDNPQGGYSSVNVDRVDYVKYPQLRYVDRYVRATMEEGDCLFIPYHWFHQVNSFANSDGQNLAINVWFRHVFNHRPIKCMNENEATLDKFVFHDDERENGNAEESKDEEKESGDEQEESVNETEEGNDYILKRVLSKNVNVKVEDSHLNPSKVKFSDDENLPEEYLEYTQQLFDLLDVVKDNKLDKNDFLALNELKKEKLRVLNDDVMKMTARLEDFFEDLVEELQQEKRRQRLLEKNSNNDQKIEL